MRFLHVPPEYHFVVPPRLHLRPGRMHIRVELAQRRHVLQPVMRQLLRGILGVSRAAQTDVGLQIVILLKHPIFIDTVAALAGEVGHVAVKRGSWLAEDSENRIEPAESAALIDAEIGRSLNGVLNRRIRPEGVWQALALLEVGRVCVDQVG